MRLRVMATGLVLIALAACSGRSDNFAGQPIEKVARNLGYPTRVIDLPDGRRTFSWDIEQRAAVGPIRPQLGGIVIGTGGASVGVGLGRDVVSTGTCTYTLTGERVGETYVIQPGPVGNPGCVM
ncbi:hypothetical protein [Roseobacter sp. HKCCA0434]|uniref:hypothetical protein n=1 Tax=Roseobacter sp. HKCCA0434 TaxID=3079297 RepID=UPI002905870A|nr:hypothetical protein [Roseobacter sp. HKCCA0434]